MVMDYVEIFEINQAGFIKLQNITLHFRVILISYAMHVVSRWHMLNISLSHKYIMLCVPQTNQDITVHHITILCRPFHMKMTILL